LIFAKNTKEVLPIFLIWLLLQMGGMFTLIQQRGELSQNGIISFLNSAPTEQKNGTVPFLEFSRTEHRVGTIPCPRNGTIPFRPPKFQNRTHPKGVFGSGTKWNGMEPFCT
jgi:hypothetical protein